MLIVWLNNVATLFAEKLLGMGIFGFSFDSSSDSV